MGCQEYAGYKKLEPRDFLESWQKGKNWPSRSHWIMRRCNLPGSLHVSLASKISAGGIVRRPLQRLPGPATILIDVDFNGLEGVACLPLAAKRCVSSKRTIWQRTNELRGLISKQQTMSVLFWCWLDHEQLYWSRNLYYQSLQYDPSHVWSNLGKSR